MSTSTPLRPALSAIQAQSQSTQPQPPLPASPRTPQRGISSTYSSPGSFRTEDDAVIISLGARFLRAGFAGDSYPRCTLSFGPEDSRRVGDYSRWLPGWDERPRLARPLDESWGAEHELWGLDFRDVDLGLVEDKLERAVRDAYSRFLLLDAKARKVVLVAETAMPKPLLSATLGVLFTDFQVPSVTLLPPATMAVVAAGMRSGIVVDVGWAVTRITAVYELREVGTWRSTRAGKMLVRDTGRMLEGFVRGERKQVEGEEEKTRLDFEYVEELLTRVIWCRMAANAGPENGTGIDHEEQQHENETKVAVPLPRSSSKPVDIPFSSLSEPVETALFADSIVHREQDDHEYALDYLLFNSLLILPPDIRSICMSRIMFTGGCVNVPGLKTRLLNELTRTVKARGWDPVWGRAAEERLRRLAEVKKQRDIAKSEVTAQKASSGDSLDEGAEIKAIAALQEQTPDPIEEKIRRDNTKGMKPGVSGEIRGVETLGAWAGASLTSALRVKSLVEIDREIFLQHGLSGPKRESEIMSSRPKSYAGGIARANISESGAWTLGAWA